MKKEFRIERVWFDDEHIYIKTDAGHVIGNPLSWYSRLNNATHKQRMNFEIGGDRTSIFWDDIDEAFTLESFFDFKRELHYARL